MPDRKKRWMVTGGLAALALGGAAWANRRLFTVNTITTGESVSYPELRSRVYYAHPAAVLAAAEQALRRLPRWGAAQRDTENLALDCEVRSPLGGVVHDVTLYLTPLGHGQTRAVIRARSRTGRGDLGRSAALIRALQDAMDARLTLDAAF